MHPSLRLPFNNTYPVTFGFGAVPDNPIVLEQYKHWGLIGHNALDFGVPAGTEVLAADAGKVVQSGDNGDFGISLTIEHPWGQSLYAHLQETKVSIGQEVKTGELIGLSGQTGNAFGPHLHFAIKFHAADLGNGYLGYVDPTPFFENQEMPHSPTQEPVKVVEKIVEREVVREVPVEKIIEREVVKEVPKEIIKEVVKEPSEEDIKALERKRLQSFQSQALAARREKKAKRLEEILIFIRDRKGATNRDLQKLFPDLSSSTLTNYLDELEKVGKIRQVGTEKAARYEPV